MISGRNDLTQRLPLVTIAQRFNAGDTVSDDVKVPAGTKGAFPACVPSIVRTMLRKDDLDYDERMRDQNRSFVP
jgi:hypothetical protein